MATSTWANGRWNPWIIYPSVADSTVDFGFASGALDATRWSAGGAALPTMVTGQGEQIGSAVRFQPAGVEYSYISTAKYETKYFKRSYSGTFYIYCRAKCTANTTNSAFTASIVFYKSDGTTTSGTSLLYAPMFTTGTTLPADSTWRVFRYAYPITTDADISKVFLQVGFQTDATNNSTVYLDWVTFGYDLNFADLGPSNHGALLVEKLGIAKSYSRTMNQADSGALEAVQQNSGLYQIQLKSTPIDETAFAAYKNFFDYCSDKSTFTLWRNQTDFSRDFVQRLILEQDNDGVSRIKGTPLYQFEIKASEAT